MERRVNMEEISDGKRYTGNDLVRADCHDCEGCSACCRGMGNTIQLDPMDIYRLTKGLSMTFEQLLASAVELQVVDGLILPNLKMTGETMACSFLNVKGGAASTPSGRASAVCSRWGGSMRTARFSISSRRASVGSRTARR